MFSSLKFTIVFIYISIIFILGSFLNTIVLIVYSKYQKNYSFVFLLISLTLLNLSSSIIQVPLVSFNELQMFPVNLSYCRCEYFISYFLNGQSVVCLVLIAYECFQMINANKKLIGITRRTKIIASILFSLGTLYSIAVIINIDIDIDIGKQTKRCTFKSEMPFTIMSALILSTFLVFISFFYLKIYLIVRNNANKVSCSIKKSTVKKLSQLSFPAVESKTDSDKNKNKNYMNIRKSWNITRKFLLVY